MIEAAENRPQPLARNAVLQVLYGSSVVGIKHYAMIVGKKMNRRTELSSN